MTAEDIIMKIEAEKVKAGEEDDKRVARSKILCSHVFIDPAFEAEAILADLGLRVFQGGQKPRDLLLGNHLHILGHPGPVHTRRR